MNITQEQIKINNKKKIKEYVWIIVHKELGAYVDFRFTKKDIIKHHLETTGKKTWKEAKKSGDKVIKATISYKVKC